MFDFRERKDLLAATIIGILFVLVFLLASLIIIWMPKEDKKEFKLGDISDTTYTDDMVISEYVENISSLLKKNDYEKLYSLVSDDYKDYSELTLESLKQKFEELEISDQEVVLLDYEKNSLEGYNNIFVTNIRGKKSSVSARIIIKENSPRNYKISFDDLILMDKNPILKNSDNVEITLLNKKYMTGSSEFVLKFKNKNKDSVYLNYNEYEDGFLLTYNGKNILKPTIPVLGYERCELKSGEEKIVHLKYNTNKITLDNISEILIKDVKFGTDRINNISFEL